MAYLYVGVLFAKENWFDLIPDELLEASAADWGLREANVSAPEEPKPTLRYTVRRLRNSLGHGRPVPTIPGNIKREEMLDKVTFSFHDVNMHKPKDTFDVVLNLRQLSTFVTKFQSTVHQHVLTFQFLRKGRRALVRVRAPRSSGNQAARFGRSRSWGSRPGGTMHGHCPSDRSGAPAAFEASKLYLHNPSKRCPATRV